MKVPVGGFGYKVAQTAPGADARATVNPKAFDTGGAELKAAADEQMKIEGQKLVLAERQRVADEEQGRRNKAANAFANYQVDLNTATTDIGNRLNEGAVTREAAQKELEDTIAKLKKDRIETLDDKSKEALGDNLTLFDGRARLHFQGELQKHARQERGSAFSTSIEALERLGTNDPASAIAQARTMFEGEGKALMGAERAGKEMQSFAERVTYNHVYSGITAASQDPKALADWAKRLKGEEFATLDPARREHLVRSVQASQLTLEQKAVVRAQRAELEAQRIDRQQAKVYDSFQTFVTTGKTPSAEYLQQTMKALRGSPYEAGVVAALEDGKHTAAWASKPLNEQRAALVQLRGQGNVEGSNPAREKQLAKMEAITKAAEADIRNDALPAAVERGVIRQLAPLNLTDLPNLAANMRERVKQADQVSGWAGHQVSPFTSDEAASLSKLMAPMKPDAKAAMLQVFGKGIEDPLKMRAFAAQIEKTDKGMSTALFLASRGIETTKGRSVAELYLRGMDAIATNTAKIDPAKETGVRAELAKQLEGVYLTPQGRDVAIDASRGIYAALKAEGQDSVDRAVNIATGGLMTHAGGRIAKPYGWTDSQFKDNLRSTSAETLRQQGGETFRAGKTTYTPEQVRQMLPGARLQTLDDGKYLVVANGEYLRQADGKPFVLKMLP